MTGVRATASRDALPPAEGQPRRLTRRQTQCLVLAARGKSDWIAGTLLGLSPATVHKYLEQAKARYGVSSRTELVVRALYHGEIGFPDLID
jgi:LuxR family quorum-sensing system transcriptional regulator CciR